LLNQLLLLATLALSTNTFAMPAPNAAASKWKNLEETDSVIQAPVCRALTQTQLGPDLVELSMAYPKDGKLLPMISLRTKIAAPLVAVQIARNVTENFYLFKAASSNDAESIYWYAPVNVARFEQLVRGGSSLTFVLDPKGTPAPVTVSLVGSTNALDAVAKCLKTVKEPLDFYKLLNSQKDNLTPSLGDRSVAFLRQNVQAAFDAYLGGQGIAVEIAALRKASAPLLAKEASAQQVLKNSQAAFTSADTKLNMATALVAALTDKLAVSKATLLAFTTEKPLATADLAAKTATYLPLKAQMVPYEKAISDDTSKVKSITSLISQNEALIARNNRLIPQLEAESSSLRRQIPGLNSRVNSARSNYDDADYKYRHYDVNSEYNSRISSDAQYNWAKSDYENASRDMDRARGDVSREQSNVSQAESKLSSCKAGPNNPPCSSEQSEVSSAQQRLSSAQSTLSQAQWKQSSAQSTMQSRQNSVRSDVQGESDRLHRISNDAESEYNSAASDLSNAQNRIAEIRSTIPQLHAQIDRATALLPQLHDQLTAAQATLASAVAARDAFSTQIGFGTAETAYLAATQHLKDTNAGIAQYTKEIPITTRDLAAAQKTIPGLTKTFTNTQAALAKATADLVPIEAQLAPYHEQLSVKQAALDAESVKFKTAQAVYQDLLKLL
jgi:chromosome segregation ATPase